MKSDATVTYFPCFRFRANNSHEQLTPRNTSWGHLDVLRIDPTALTPRNTGALR